MRKPFRFLPAAVLVGFLGFAAYSLKGPLENGLPKDLFFGCYAHPEHGRFDISAEGLRYNGTAYYKRWGGTKMTGAPQIIANPQYGRRVESDGTLKFTIVKDGESAQDFYDFADGPPGQRALIVRTGFSGDLVFLEIPCQP